MTQPRLWWTLLRHRVVAVDGHRIHVPPTVLDPVLFRSGAWFARWVADHITSGSRLLDLGCGTGIVGVLAQQRGAQVVASDIAF